MPSVLFDGECGMVVEKIQEHRASSGGRGLSLMVFLELRREPGVYSRVTAGMALQH